MIVYSVVYCKYYYYYNYAEVQFTFSHESHKQKGG